MDGRTKIVVGSQYYEEHLIEILEYGIVIEKAKVFAINYENGTREVINVITETKTETAPAEKKNIEGAHRKNFYIGVYVNPVGCLFAGPMVGVEFTVNNVRSHEFVIRASK